MVKKKSIRRVLTLATQRKIAELYFDQHLTIAQVGRELKIFSDTVRKCLIRFEKRGNKAVSHRYKAGGKPFEFPDALRDYLLSDQGLKALSCLSLV
jgi:response regulator of citrate/malate metabolism